MSKKSKKKINNTSKPIRGSKKYTKIYNQIKNRLKNNKSLKSQLIKFSDKEGQKLWLETNLKDAGLLKYWRLQSSDTTCGLCSLMMVINSIDYDCKKYDDSTEDEEDENNDEDEKLPLKYLNEESTLNAVRSNDKFCKKVYVSGMSLSQMEYLSRENFLDVEKTRMNEMSIDSFRKLIIKTYGKEGKKNKIIVNLSLYSLDYIGGGHFSPLGGYHQESDRVLFLDVSGLPRVWIKLTDLYNACNTVPIHCQFACDCTTSTRGFVLIENE